MLCQYDQFLTYILKKEILFYWKKLKPSRRIVLDKSRNQLALGMESRTWVGKNNKTKISQPKNKPAREKIWS